MTAAPIAAPIWRLVLSKPVAAPAITGGTSCMATVMSVQVLSAGT